MRRADRRRKGRRARAPVSCRGRRRRRARADRGRRRRPSDGGERCRCLPPGRLPARDAGALLELASSCRDAAVPATGPLPGAWAKTALRVARATAQGGAPRADGRLSGARRRPVRRSTNGSWRTQTRRRSSQSSNARFASDAPRARRRRLEGRAARGESRPPWGDKRSLPERLRGKRRHIRHESDANVRQVLPQAVSDVVAAALASRPPIHAIGCRR